jgi:hypothetical protein
MCMKYHASTKISNTIQEGGTKTKRILKMNSGKKLFKRWSNITFEGLFTYIFHLNFRFYSSLSKTPFIIVELIFTIVLVRIKINVSSKD